MITESQNIEFKESWRDEYQKWICGFTNAFFRAGEIEAWGRGIERIITACKNDGFSTPEFRYDASGIWTTFKFEYPERATTQYDPETTQRSDRKAAKANRMVLLLSFLRRIHIFQERDFWSIGTT